MPLWRRKSLHFVLRLRFGLKYALNKPASHAIKVQTVQKYGNDYGIHCLVETGTYQGDMVAACLPNFERIISVELFEPLYEAACLRFRAKPNVTIIRGDSADRLPEILQNTTEPCLFWLDGHYSGGETGRGSRDTPILSELAGILSHPVKGHVILIDDARLFVGHADYPTRRRVRKIADQANLDFRVEKDIIRMTPKTGR